MKKNDLIKAEKRNKEICKENEKQHSQVLKEITASKESALAFLVKTGVYDEKGNLKAVFR